MSSPKVNSGTGRGAFGSRGGGGVAGAGGRE